MSIEKELRELVKKKGLRQTARELAIDSGSLYRSITDGSNVGLDRVRAILNLFGYELKISKRRKMKPGKKPRRLHGGHVQKRRMEK
jgi:DNA-binding phage protein